MLTGCLSSVAVLGVTGRIRDIGRTDDSQVRQFWRYQNYQHTLKTWTKLVVKRQEKTYSYVLKLLSAREHFIEFCRRESFKAEVNKLTTRSDF